MIYINFNGSKIPANNDGTPISPPSYWTQEILDGIAAAFTNGDWESVPEPTPVPNPNWEGFNLALLQDPGYTFVSSTVASAAPSVLIALNVALDNLRKGDISAEGFGIYVEAFCQIGQPTAQQREDWAAIAAINDLPDEIIAIIEG